MGQSKGTVQKGRESRVKGNGILYLMDSLKPYLIVFLASACTLIIEIVAARILAPSVGVSLYTWTSIIGVVLAGISIGNYLGGRLADRFPSTTTLGLILLFGGIFSLGVLPLVDVISEAFQMLDIIPRIVFLTATLFFMPSLILGMVSPVIIKLRLSDLDHTGNVVGKIYAVSTAGAIFGTFITGFFLIQWIGTRTIILVVALVLLLMALAFGNLWRLKLPALVGLIVFSSIGGFTIFSGSLTSECLEESSYYCIRVQDTIKEGQKVKALSLDALVHSFISVQNPTFLVTGYQNIFAEIATYVAQENQSLQVLFIGGGGYVMPRYLEELYPQSTLEVIEIDPEVTRVAFDYLGLSPDTRVVTYNEDARMTVLKLPEGQYGLVFSDAFNDLSVPYQLTTKEFNEQVRVLLKEDGIYAVNIVDKLHSGKFLRAYVNTLKQTFPYVYLIRDTSDWRDDRRGPQVVVGSFQPLSVIDFMDALTQAGRVNHVSHITPDDTLTSWLKAQPNVLLTDDYSPVDNLMASIHLEKNILSEGEKHYKAGLQLQNEEKFMEAIDEYDESIRLEPYNAIVYNNRGTSYARLGQHQIAIKDFDEAIRLDPQYVLAYNNRGIAYATLGEFERSIQDFDETIRLEPYHTSAYNNRGTSYYQLGQFQLAINDYNEAIRLNPENAQNYAFRAQLYTILNMDVEAEQDFDSAVRLGLDPSSLRAEIEELKEQR